MMSAMTSPSPLSVTRVINPCVLISVDDAIVLTDPFFANLRRLPMREPIGLRVDQLPSIDAILGGHGAFDHWQLGPLRGVLDSEVPVLVPHERMGARAVRHGFTGVRQTRDGERFAVTECVSVTTVAGDRIMGQPTNHYVISGAAGTVYVGTEACSLGPMRRLSGSMSIDVAVLPIDGLTFAGKRLVMDAAKALEATQLLGARALVPIHYSQRSVWPLIRCRSGVDDLLSLPHGGVEIRHAASGVRIDLDPGRHVSEPR